MIITKAFLQTKQRKTLNVHCKVSVLSPTWVSPYLHQMDERSEYCTSKHVMLLWLLPQQRQVLNQAAYVWSDLNRRENKMTNVKQHMMLDRWRWAASVMQIAQNQSNVTQVSSRQTCHVSLMTNQMAEMDLASMLLTSILPPREVGFFILLVFSDLLRQTRNQKMAQSFKGIFKTELGWHLCNLCDR